ncbi:MAG TPA: PEGA domain-containing protein [Planctomycetes bacterium]|nr:PEGA domain-containing protein [Planctomycetota bacterium]
MKTRIGFVAVLALSIMLAAGTFAEEDVDEGAQPDAPKPPAAESLLPPSLDDIIAEEGKPQPARETPKTQPAKPDTHPAKLDAATAATGRVDTAAVAPQPARPGVPRVAVLPFVNSVGQRGAAETVTRISAPTLVDKLVSTGKVDVIERGRLDAVLEEVQFAKSGLVDAGTAVSMGKLLGATHIVTGDVRQVSRDRQIIKAYNVESIKDAYHVVVLVRVIDAASGRVVSSHKAEKTREEIVTKYNEKQEGDIVTPLAEQAFEGVIGDIVKAMVPEKKDVKTYVFLVNSAPEGADVEIDGVFEGNCPLETEVEAGIRLVRVTLPGYEVWEQKVRVRADARRPIVARLRPKPETTTTDVNVTINKP